MIAAQPGGSTAAQWLTALIIIGILCAMFTRWQRTERDARKRVAAWKQMVVDSPELEHVTVYRVQPPSFAYDWARLCPDLRSPVPAAVEQRGEHATA